MRRVSVTYTRSMTDYPDWQTFPNAQSDNIFASFTQVLAPGVHLGAMLPALSWSSLFVIAVPSAGAGKVTVTHFADLAGTLPIDSDTWSVNAATRLIVRTPLRGKYIRVDINVTSAGNMTVQNWATLLSASSDRISFPVSNQNLSDFDHVMPIAGSTTYNIGEICAGNAFFYYNPYDALGKLRILIHAVDELGVTGQLIADFGKPTATFWTQLQIPDVIVQVNIVSTDASATHTYDFSLTVPPQ
jgi:hypothetical protein